MLRCSVCGSTYDEAALPWRCACGAPLDWVIGAGVRTPDDLSGRPASLWRYREVLPCGNDDGCGPVSLGEGMTPLVRAAWDGAEILWKLDFLCPTGSYKDRGASVLMSRLRDLGVRDIIEDSSGNAGAAMAAYSARAGVRCRIFVPDYTSEGKCVQISSYGAELVRVAGSREDTTAAAERAAQTEGTYYASHNWSPYFAHGVKTLAYELVEELGGAVPDSVIVPAGQGSLVLGCDHAFSEMLASGRIAKRPRIYAVQAAHCAPLYRAFSDGSQEPATIEKHETIAEGISSALPVRGRQVLAAVRRSGGAVLTVDEDEIAPGCFRLARLGLYVEPTSSVVGAAVSRLLKTGAIRPDERTAAVLTGTGLKATDKILHLAERNEGGRPTHG